MLLLARVMVLQQALDRVSPTLSELGDCSLCSLDSLSSSGLSGHLSSWIPVDMFFNLSFSMHVHKRVGRDAMVSAEIREQLARRSWFYLSTLWGSLNPAQVLRLVSHHLPC